MIGVSEGNYIVVPRVSSSHEQRQIVGFGTGVDKVTNFQFARQFRSKLLGKFRNIWMKVNCGGMLQGFILPPYSLDDMRMAMSDADRDDPSQAIQVTFAAFIPD